MIRIILNDLYPLVAPMKRGVVRVDVPEEDTARREGTAPRVVYPRSSVCIRREMVITDDKVTVS